MCTKVRGIEKCPTEELRRETLESESAYRGHVPESSY